MPATLTISHYIYLNREDRYKLFEKQPVESVGVCIPVWFYKGSTSEPAKEFFCKYNITNIKDLPTIESQADGFRLNLPQKFINAKNYLQSSRLLDVEDGGCEELIFRKSNKMLYKSITFDVIHFVEIKNIETLLQTI
jgi:hypothetical protein